mmetsp:Transcript_70292/g.124142  ORF Transcript_70292/g.124142 Transcript_70292/m.124142 type:complete len:200 (+) Transcript_70292:131-730(+)|eukprot:CAMPEP_0197662098 /NCGR_PEP_ID=MMETSP1338-20131121/52113_1 /TAXON_ID=43686 ORGANISM="Pelagodinium beii, Strain RCC1491" /NCGR_SAMPLE_ID=MMETSP1338 /ASSEMBLY_ACC=CAM_ASM_000754 /LENGTH=199 /DNA_ID=CAMNT_0043239807 /DNA_START=76 /DNA_END=675 /DNA_ORIENTATION=+
MAWSWWLVFFFASALASSPCLEDACSSGEALDILEALDLAVDEDDGSALELLQVAGLRSQAPLETEQKDKALPVENASSLPAYLAPAALLRQAVEAVNQKSSITALSKLIGLAFGLGLAVLTVLKMLDRPKDAGLAWLSAEYGNLFEPQSFEEVKKVRKDDALPQPATVDALTTLPHSVEDGKSSGPMCPDKSPSSDSD